MMGVSKSVSDVASLAELVIIIEEAWEVILYARWNLFLRSSLTEASK